MSGIIVIGPESSGNRLMLRLLIAAGCDGYADPPYADVEPHAGKPFAWLRSVPYAQEVPDLRALIARAWSYTPHVKAVIMLRDMYPSLMSQVRIGHAPDYENAKLRTIGALLTIFRTLDQTRLPFVIVTYAGLVNHTSDIVQWLMPELGLKVPVIVEETYDGDREWWRERQPEAR